MSFENLIVYEDRDELHTSRWKLDGISTKSDGKTDSGWLWMNATKAGNDLTVDLYKDVACDAGDKVATGVSDISAIATAAVKITLAEANSSGMSGELYAEEYTADVAAVPVLVSLCVDADLVVEYRRLASLPNYDATNGMAEECARATDKVLLLVSQMFKEQLGGYGAGEHRNLTSADRLYPDYRCISQPKQLREAAVHCALALIFWSGHELADHTMYSELGQRHESKYDQAVGSWNLAFNTDPDTDDDADESGSGSIVRPERI